MRIKNKELLDDRAALEEKVKKLNHERKEVEDLLLDYQKKGYFESNL